MSVKEIILTEDEITKTLQEAFDGLTFERMEEIAEKAAEYSDPYMDGEESVDQYTKMLFLMRFVYIQGFSAALNLFNENCKKHAEENPE